MENGKVIAKGNGTIYFIRIYSDGSAALMYDNGYTVGTWAAVNRLRAHFLHLANVKTVVNGKV